ncbi:MAG: tRNA glutamyl-Q(34) synthetase GluQRS, partial [Gammaproteobacteria bacterium]|nr:tRNA glutamyl-Q(34) synthetase GluQRS [Gammaproteobacteria bacterium]
CRLAIPPGKTSRTIRLHVPGPHVEVRDRVLGENRILTADFGNDFVIQRADDVAAYHLACVVDDAALGITHIVRGADLLTSTAAQQSLIQGLGLPEILYAHIPIVVDAARIKLSKRAHATPTNQFAGATVLSEALHALGMAPAPALQTDIDELLAWAIGAWDMAGVATDTILAPPHFGGAG